MAASLPSVCQRLVRTNPKAGAQNLFLGSHVRKIEGMSQAVGGPGRQTDRSGEHNYVHAGQPGGIVLWDNRCLSRPEAATTPAAAAATCADPRRRNVLDIGGGWFS
jgi:alpha-ketoglutarate-dependent taurine dioxygenase